MRQTKIYLGHQLVCFTNINENEQVLPSLNIVQKEDSKVKNFFYLPTSSLR